MHSTTGSSGYLHYCTSLEEVTGETPDISEYLAFVFYDWCWYNGNSGIGETKLVKWMGVSHRIIRLMSQWVLTANRTIVSRTNISRVKNIKAQTDENKSRITVLDKAIQGRLNDKGHVIVEGGKGKPKDWSEHPFDRDPCYQEEFSHVVSNDKVTEADNDFSPDFYDETYLSMQLALPKRGQPEPQFDHVTKRLRDANGIPLGKASDNRILDKRMYDVEYADGKNSSLSDNLIAEKTFTQIYERVNYRVLIDNITNNLV